MGSVKKVILADKSLSEFLNRQISQKPQKHSICRAVIEIVFLQSDTLKTRLAHVTAARASEIKHKGRTEG